MNKEDILQFILIRFSQVKAPQRKDVENQVDGLLDRFPELKTEKEWVLNKAWEYLVTAVKPSSELFDPDTYIPWLEKEDRSSWASWPWLELYLKHKLHRPVRVIQELDQSTNRILDLLGDPKADAPFDRRGLVVGHVQSGKTQHYTALAAKAIDAGYKVIIILSGIHENLRQQTQERIEECILGKNSRDGWNPCGVRTFRMHGTKIPPLGPIDSCTSFEGDYGVDTNRMTNHAIGNTPVVFVVKKNASILRNLLNKIRGPYNNIAIQKAPVLIIDDEADHSSVNTGNLDEDPKAINRLIRALLWCCDKVGFVGYTATPYANIFMDPELDSHERKADARTIDNIGFDLFPRAFIISTKAPDNYIGPDVVFGHDGDETIGIPEVSPLPMHIGVEDADVWLPPGHKKPFQVTTDLPESLCTALKCFVLSVATRMSLGQETSHCSMLVHVTRFNKVQEQVLRQIQAHMNSLLNMLVGGDPKRRNALIQTFSELWDHEFVAKFSVFQAHPSQINDPPKLPAWVDVKSQINLALERLTFALVNSQSKQGLDFAENQDEGLIVIAIGGDRLSRGLTLEGLTVSYFLRGARAYDTLMQMGRWFGYRPGYAHLCRVFAPLAILTSFRTIVLATEELRREFDMMSFLKRTPVNYGLRVREPRGDLLVTAINKMRRGVSVRIHFSSSFISSLDIKETDLNSNYKAFGDLITKLGNNYGTPSHIEAPGGPARIWRDIPWNNISQFMSEYNATVNTCLDRVMSSGKSLLHTYIESVTHKSDLIKWTVVVIGSSKGTRRVLGLDKGFFAGNRNRLLDENDAPLHPGRVTFRGVAYGGDESIDLNDKQLQAAQDQREESGGKLSLASIYRKMRPSTHGLLLIYPIIPTTLGEAKKNGKSDKGYLWSDKDPVIGIGVSLPNSEHDNGCDYLCTNQKLKEIFGEISEDLRRDDEEDAASTSSDNP